MKEKPLSAAQAKKDITNLASIVQTVLEKNQDANKLTWLNADIYLVGDDTLEDLLTVSTSADLLNQKRKKPITNPLNDIMKILNKNSPCTSFNLTKKDKYVYITTSEKVDVRVGSSFPVWKNEKINLVEALLKEKEYSDEFIQEVKEKTKKEITARTNLFEFISKNKNAFNRSYTTAMVEKIKPTIYFHTLDKKGIQEHLRDSVPNILWYKPGLKPKKRTNSTVDKRMENGFEVFRGYFVEPKETSGPIYNEFVKLCGLIHAYEHKG